MFGRRPFFAAIAATGLALCLALVATLSFAQNTPQDTPQETSSDARNFVEQLGRRAINELTPKDISDAVRIKRTQALLADSFAMPTIAKFVLGVYWRRATQVERGEFLKLYRTVVAYGFSRLFKGYAGETFQVNKQRPAPGGGVIVYGSISQIGNKPVLFEVRVKKFGDRFKTVDFKVAGVSMPLAHRKEYSSVVRQRRGKVSGLLSILRRKAKFLKK